MPPPLRRQFSALDSPLCANMCRICGSGEGEGPKHLPPPSQIHLYSKITKKTLVHVPPYSTSIIFDLTPTTHKKLNIYWSVHVQLHGALKNMSTLIKTKACTCSCNKKDFKINDTLLNVFHCKDIMYHYLRCLGTIVDTMVKNVRYNKNTFTILKFC